MNSMLTILLVEDNEDDVTLFSSALRKANVLIQLHSVADGEEAIAYLDQKDASSGPYEIPDVVLLDLNMPRRNGFEVLQWIREDPRFTLLMVHVFTTSSRQADVQRAYALRANSYLVKPSHIHDLVLFIQSLAGWHRCVTLPSQATPAGLQS